MSIKGARRKRETQGAWGGAGGASHVPGKPSAGGFLFTLIHSDRRTMAIEIGRDRQVKVRVPWRTKAADAQRFVDAHGPWVLKRLQQLGDAPPEPDEAVRSALMAQAKQVLPGLVERWARAVGVQPKGLTMTGARTRFGSCSSKGRLCFSYHVMRYPMSAIECVVLHEVCHLKHLNHGNGFYALLSHHMPDHKERRKLLRQPPQEEYT